MWRHGKTLSVATARRAGSPGRISRSWPQKPLHSAVSMRRALRAFAPHQKPDRARSRLAAPQMGHRLRLRARGIEAHAAAIRSSRGQTRLPARCPAVCHARARASSGGAAGEVAAPAPPAAPPARRLR
eukprot:scaffold181863_cov31-Tisochrysis_lutea.AAC.3